MCPDGSTGIGPVDMKGRIILQRPTSLQNAGIAGLDQFCCRVNHAAQLQGREPISPIGTYGPKA